MQKDNSKINMNKEMSRNIQDSLKAKYKIESLSPLEAAIYADREVDVVKRNIMIEMTSDFTDFLKYYLEIVELKKRSYKNISLTILGFSSIENKDLYDREISIMRTAGDLNIYNPADIEETESVLDYLSQKVNLENNEKSISYLRIDESLKESLYKKSKSSFDGTPEIVYMTKKLDSHRDITIISSGIELESAINIARKMEREENAKVTVINLSTLHTSVSSLTANLNSLNKVASNTITKNIDNFFLNYTHHHKEFVFLSGDTNSNTTAVTNDTEYAFREVLKRNKIWNIKITTH